MRSIRRHRFALIIAISLLTMLSGKIHAQRSVVAAASDLQFALEAVNTQFSIDTGHAVDIVYGSSGNFYRQISQGAPFQLFLSADETYVEQLVTARLTEDTGLLYGVGRIVIMAPTGSMMPVDSQLDGLREAIASGAIRRFAIANPDHAPYGQRAEEALRHSGLWTALESQLVFGENVSQAAQFASSGNAQGGIIAYSLALAPNIARLGEFALIPEEWHTPLRQRMVLMRDAGPAVRAFYDYLQQATARSILRQYGFVLPGEN
jgi:molybdate transport system substrate-binding protein